MIELTERAAQMVKSLLERYSEEGSVLRVQAFPGCCSGLSYQMMLDNQVDTQDQIVEVNGIRIAVDPESAALLQGSIIDFVENEQGQGFVIQNPNVDPAAHSGGCGCGGHAHADTAPSTYETEADSACACGNPDCGCGGH